MPAFFTPEQAVLLVTTPYAFWMASLVGAANLKAARKTPVPPKPEEVEQKPVSKLKKAVSVGCFIVFQLAIFFGVQIALNRLSAGAMDSFLNGMVSFAFVSWSGPVLLDLLGQIDTSFARFHGGALVAHYKLGWRQLMMLVLSVAACSHFLPRTDIGHYVIVALLALTVPVNLAKIPVQKTASFRWLIAAFAGVPIAAIAFGAIVAAVLTSIPESALDSFGELIVGDEETRTKPEEHDFRSFRGLWLFQVLVLCGFCGSIVAMLHRADQHIAGLKTSGAVALAEHADDEDEVTLLEPLPAVGSSRGPSGARVPVPSTRTLVKRNFVAAHRSLLTSVTYAKVAGFAALVAVGPIASSIRLAMGSPDATMENLEMTDLFSEMFAIYLFPWLVITAVSALALARGEFREIWNYREDWTAPASETPANDEAGSDEKAALIQA